MTEVDILDPNDFYPTGRVVDIHEAWREGLWIGCFNLWVVQMHQQEAYILYQRRAANATWAADRLDVTVGGHYEAGEQLFDGLREAEEEIGRHYHPNELRVIGRKVYLADKGARRIRNVVDICIVQDDAPLAEFKLQESELSGLYRCRIHDLIRLHEGDISSFMAEGISIIHGTHAPDEIQVDTTLFPFNWDDYHRKMAYLCKKFLSGTEPLFY